MVVCSSPATALGLQTLLERHGHRVDVWLAWRGPTVAQIVITDIPAGADTVQYLNKVRNEAAAAQLIVWGPPAARYAEAAPLYRKWLVPSTPLEGIVAAAEECAQPRRRYLTGAPTLSAVLVSGAKQGALTRKEVELVSAFDPAHNVVLTRRELAMRMNLSVPAVRYHVRNILAKTGLKSLRDLQRLPAAEIADLAHGHSAHGS